MTLNEKLMEASKQLDYLSHYLEPILQDVIRGFFFQYSLMELQVLSIIIIISVWAGLLFMLMVCVSANAEIVKKESEHNSGQVLTSSVCKGFHYGLLVLGWRMLYYFGYALTTEPLYFLSFSLLVVWLSRILVLRLYDPETKEAAKKARKRKDLEHLFEQKRADKKMRNIEIHQERMDGRNSYGGLVISPLL
jgi:hypothetical protein